MEKALAVIMLVFGIFSLGLLVVVPLLKAAGKDDDQRGVK